MIADSRAENRATESEAVPRQLTPGERRARYVRFPVVPRPASLVWLARILAAAAIVFGVRYLWWRAVGTATPAAPWFWVLFLTAEVLGFGSAALSYVTTWRQRFYADVPSIPGRTVDVLVATYNEPLDVLRDTIAAAAALTYPHRTLVLDDGARAEVAALAREFGCVYVTRPDNRHAKAGNLNHGLRLSDAEFLVTLDADHVPLPDLVERLIGYFVDEQVALVQANQDFYNLDSFQHEVDWHRRTGWQMQEYFFNVVQPGRDALGGVVYCGSPAMLRRAALDDIGGFATGSITEDIHTGLRLQRRGWRVMYVNRSVARGLAPQTYVGFANQWRRWGTGPAQLMHLERPVLGPGLTLGQRICYVATYEYSLIFSYTTLVKICTIIVSLLTGIFPLLARPLDYAWYYLPYVAASLATTAVLSGNWRTPFLMERYNFVKLFSSLGTWAGLRRRELHFRVTPKARDAGGTVREAWPHIASLILLYVAGIVGIVQAWRTRDGGLLGAYLVTTVFAIYYFAVGAPGVARIFERNELRGNYRFPRGLDLRVSYEAFRVTAEGRLSSIGETFARNVNRHGLSITLDQELPVGTFVRLRLSLPDRSLETLARVAWAREFDYEGAPRYACGLQFLVAGEDDRDALMRHLFQEVAPRHGELLLITTQHQPQRLPDAAADTQRPRGVSGPPYESEAPDAAA